jgi:DNA-directed RNA polymerase subunit H (RpoH/RPB5)
MTDINKNIKLFKSRNIILKLLSDIDYDISDYEVFSCNEIDAMNKTGQLDMLINHKDKEIGKKVYVKFYLPEKQKQISKTSLDNIIEDLFQLKEKIMEKQDTLIIIIDDEPNDSNIQRMNYLYDNDQIFISMFNIKRLQFNIKEHHLVPPMEILSDDAVTKLMVDKQLKTLSQLPEISRYDPQAMVLLLRPGQVCKIERTSKTALQTIYYRACV